MAEMTFSQKKKDFEERKQRVELALARLEESTKQKTREAQGALDEMESITGTRTMAGADAKANEAFERLQIVFNNLDAALRSCEDLVQQATEGFDVSSL